MKNIAILLLLLTSLASNAQTAPPHTNKQVPLPEYFLDSVQVRSEYVTYLNPEELSDVHVDKNEKYPNGAIFITLKNHSLVDKLLKDKLLSLNNIRNANITKADSYKPVIYLIDDNLLTDTANVRIPSMFIRNVSMVKAAETAYFKTALPNVLLLKINTKPPKIRIRGEIAAR